MPESPVWSYGITTHHSRHSTLFKQTIESLSRAGFPNPQIFLDGMQEGWTAPSDQLDGVTIRQPATGQYANWLLGLIQLFYAQPRAHYYAMFEDDLLACSNLREYIERTYPTDANRYLNLITHDQNLVLTGGVDGWHASNQLGKGGVGLVFNRKVFRELMSSDLILRGVRGIACGDGMTIQTLKPKGIIEYIHHPTLLQHTGEVSVLGHKYGKMKGWRGEDYDPLTLTEGGVVEKSKKEQALERMVPPSMMRPNVWRGGVMQIHITRGCDKQCFGCTQGSNLRGAPASITLEQFENACKSLKGYWGVVGLFGGNPATHPKFKEICEIALDYFPKKQLGLWCNNPLGKGSVMRNTFNPAVSNLNVHLDQKAYDEFKRDWPECMPFGLDKDSRHSPPFVAMKDVEWNEDKRWDMIAECDINQNWSAMVCAVPGKGLRGFFCEIAGAMAILHANDPEWPDNGINLDQWLASGEPSPWWQLPMKAYEQQVEWNCHRCGVPLKRYGQLAMGGSYEETTMTHLPIYKPKDKKRLVRTVKDEDAPVQTLGKFTDYIGNSDA